MSTSTTTRQVRARSAAPAADLLTSLLNDTSVNVKLGSKMMGREHTDKVCVLRRPTYGECGWFFWSGITFVQMCHGEAAARSEDFFVGVLEEVRKN